jgi:hypothetical protein
MAAVSVVEVAVMSLDKGILRHYKDGVMGTVMNRVSSASSYSPASLQRGEEKRWRCGLKETLGEEERG